MSLWGLINNLCLILTSWKSLKLLMTKVTRISQMRWPQGAGNFRRRWCRLPPRIQVPPKHTFARYLFLASVVFFPSVDDTDASSFCFLLPSDYDNKMAGNYDDKWGQNNHTDWRLIKGLEWVICLKKCYL